jgi:hypothetical protein
MDEFLHLSALKFCDDTDSIVLGTLSMEASRKAGFVKHACLEVAVVPSVVMSQRSTK